jgi:hypothetical protein
VNIYLPGMAYVILIVACFCVIAVSGYGYWLCGGFWGRSSGRKDSKALASIHSKAKTLSSASIGRNISPPNTNPEPDANRFHGGEAAEEPETEGPGAQIVIVRRGGRFGFGRLVLGWLLWGVRIGIFGILLFAEWAVYFHPQETQAWIVRSALVIGFDISPENLGQVMELSSRRDRSELSFFEWLSLSWSQLRP